MPCTFTFANFSPLLSAVAGSPDWSVASSSCPSSCSRTAGATSILFSVVAWQVEPYWQVLSTNCFFLSLPRPELAFLGQHSLGKETEPPVSQILEGKLMLVNLRLEDISLVVLLDEPGQLLGIGWSKEGLFCSLPTVPIMAIPKLLVRNLPGLQLFTTLGMIISMRSIITG